MRFLPERKDRLKKIQERIQYFLVLRESNRAAFEISGFFKNDFVKAILSEFGNSVSREEYKTVVLNLLRTYRSRRGSEYCVQREFLRYLHSAEKENPNIQKNLDLLRASNISSADMFPEYPHKARWTFASGKGGTGKSFLAAGIAAGLAAMGYTVVLIDADLGAPNLHNHLKLKRPDLSLDDFFLNTSTRLESLITETPLQNLRFIHGASNFPGAASTKKSAVRILRREIKGIEADIVITDIGSGTNSTALDLFNTSPGGILVTNPDPNAIQDTYFFLKSAFYRKIRGLCNADPDFKAALLEYIKLSRSEKLDIPGFKLFLQRKHPKPFKSFTIFSKRYHPKLILNKVFTKSQKSESEKLCRLAESFMGIDLEYLGDISFSKKLNKSYSDSSPYICSNPNDRVTRQIHSILSLLDSSDLRYFEECGFREFKSALQNMNSFWYNLSS